MTARCPSCGKKIQSISAAGPSTHTLDCGCDVGPLTARDIAATTEARQ